MAFPSFACCHEAYQGHSNEDAAMTTSPSLAQISLSLQEIEVLEGAVANAILHAEAHISVVSKGGPADKAIRERLTILFGLRAALTEARVNLHQNAR